MSAATLIALVVLGLLCLAAAFGAGYAFALIRSAQLAERAPVGSPEEAGEGPPDSIVATRLEPSRVAFARLPAEGSDAWRASMAELGSRMRTAGTRLVVFAHGSFVGNDPLALARTLEGAAAIVPGRPRFAPHLARGLRGFTRAQASRILGDLSNFPPDYVAALAAAIGIEAADFTWSGENHHAARVQEAVRLARTLASHLGGGRDRSAGAGAALAAKERVLLVGHSHGGQLFAILSQLLAQAHGYEELVHAAAARGEDVQVLEEHLGRLRRCDFDVATFGTPPRYAFASGARFRVLHLVNHRPSAAARSASLRGLLHTRHGDYVHHLGAPGSDWPALSAKDRALNQRLDRILGVGTDVRVWLRHVGQGLRVSPHGHTVLVDYGDQARVVPNFLATGLGHAAYTRREAMLFHMQLVTDHFYPAVARRSLLAPS
jgi:hypothetical protein